MKKTASLLLPLIFAAVAAATSAAPASLPITVDDLAAAGVQKAVAVPPDHDRFRPPVAYFRTPEKLSAADAKLDCTDCADLIAIYAAETSSIPSWVTETKMQFVKIGGRLQVRAYIAAKKRVITVTAPSEATARKISAYLVSKFSK